MICVFPSFPFFLFLGAFADNHDVHGDKVGGGYEERRGSPLSTLYVLRLSLSAPLPAWEDAVESRLSARESREVNENISVSGGGDVERCLEGADWFKFKLGIPSALVSFLRLCFE